MIIKKMNKMLKKENYKVEKKNIKKEKKLKKEAKKHELKQEKKEEPKVIPVQQNFQDKIVAGLCDIKEYILDNGNKINIPIKSKNGVEWQGNYYSLVQETVENYN